MAPHPSRFEPILREADELFKLCAKRTKILTSLTWPAQVAEEFFKNREAVLPAPTYSIDNHALAEVEAALKKFAPKIKGDNPLYQWLRNIADSFQTATVLLRNLESDTFFKVSTELYGNTQSEVFHGQTSHKKLADAIQTRLSTLGFNVILESNEQKSAEELIQELSQRMSSYKPPLPLKLELSTDIVAKAVAGTSRIRVRKDARFSALDLESMWNHEVESHCLTALNGSRQPVFQFLASGGPRTTKTQEGLAVFHEIFGHTMSQGRLIAICNRVQGVHMVEQGADFIELYRWFKERSDSKTEAFFSTQRIFRGAKLKGGAPFTKDIVYLAGLLEIFNFLRLAAKNQNRILLESLVNGRIALEDVGMIAWLRTHGLMDPPFYLPSWLRNWEGLLSFFSFSSVFELVDIAAFQSSFDDVAHMQSWDVGL